MDDKEQKKDKRAKRIIRIIAGLIGIPGIFFSVLVLFEGIRQSDLYGGIAGILGGVVSFALTSTAIFGRPTLGHIA